MAEINLTSKEVYEILVAHIENRYGVKCLRGPTDFYINNVPITDDPEMVFSFQEDSYHE